MLRRGKPNRERQGHVGKLSHYRHFGTNRCQVAQTTQVACRTTLIENATQSGLVGSV